MIRTADEHAAGASVTLTFELLANAGVSCAPGTRTSARIGVDVLAENRLELKMAGNWRITAVRDH
jgi:hypothetical protein